ncbi:MAG: biotin--[acetyl-CoA-carboxylase] ligase [Verrucomicrobiae bacterium]|nr:biotin--[acetyl-CoA-carboxylase] ligase [Verrucomicrobiae bacterium]
MSHDRDSFDVELLRTFYAAEGRYVSGEELAQKLGISRTAVWAHIAEFRKLGYVFESTPHVGYRLAESPDSLLGDDLMARSSCKFLGRPTVVYRQTSSTNDRVAELARQNAAEGLAVFAEKQTQGRGRMRRRWASQDRKGLWFSFLLRAGLPTRAASQLTIMTALAVVKALHEASGAELEIKWPNDIHFKGRKVAGILTEIEGDLDRIHYAVVGVGINVNHQPEDFPPELDAIATSLRIAADRPFHRPELAVKVLARIEEHYEALRNGAFAELLSEWAQWDRLIGRQISVRTGERVVSGQATHVDEDGALVLRLDSGVSERVTSGDVTVTRID